MSLESIPRGESRSFDEDGENKLRLGKRTEAGRLLTKIAGLLVPELLSQHTEISALALSDGVTEEDFSTHEPLPEKKRKDSTITSLVRKLERIGFGLAVSEHASSYTEDPATNTLVLGELLNPWNYTSDGTLDILIDKNELLTSINRISDNEKKTEALNQLNELFRILESEQTESPRRYIESLREPDRVRIARLVEKLDSIDESIISSVEAITTEADALNHSGRARLKAVYPELSAEWKASFEHTKLEIDHDRSRYPDFWAVQNRMYRIYNAIGAINRGVLRHDMVKI